VEGLAGQAGSAAEALAPFRGGGSARQWGPGLLLGVQGAAGRGAGLAACPVGQPLRQHALALAVGKLVHAGIGAVVLWGRGEEDRVEGGARARA
jgi:hypothetical protein